MRVRMSLDCRMLASLDSNSLLRALSNRRNSASTVDRNRARARYMHTCNSSQILRYGLEHSYREGLSVT